MGRDSPESGPVCAWGWDEGPGMGTQRGDLRDACSKVGQGPAKGQIVQGGNETQGELIPQFLSPEGVTGPVERIIDWASNQATIGEGEMLDEGDDQGPQDESDDAPMDEDEDEDEDD